VNLKEGEGFLAKPPRPGGFDRRGTDPIRWIAVLRWRWPAGAAVRVDPHGPGSKPTRAVGSRSDGPGQAQVRRRREAGGERWRSGELRRSRARELGFERGWHQDDEDDTSDRSRAPGRAVGQRRWRVALQGGKPRWCHLR
jgi:hypothetical protein